MAWAECMSRLGAEGMAGAEATQRTEKAELIREVVIDLDWPIRARAAATMRRRCMRVCPGMSGGVVVISGDGVREGPSSEGAVVARAAVLLARCVVQLGEVASELDRLAHSLVEVAEEFTKLCVPGVGSGDG